MAKQGGSDRHNVIRLKDHWPENHDTIIIRSGEAVDMAILKQAYEDIYLPNFPLSEGNDTLQDWLNDMANPKAVFDYTITIIGDNLRPPRKGTAPAGKPVIKGFCLGQYAPDSDTGYLAYIAVDPSARAEGLGKRLFQHHNMAMLDAARRHGGVLKGLFLDCTDPHKAAQMGVHDEYGAEKRMAKYAEWGGAQVPIDLSYPYSYEDPKKRVRYGALVAFPHPLTGKYPMASAVRGFLKSFYRNFGIRKPKKDADFKRMTGELKQAVHCKDVKKHRHESGKRRHCYGWLCATA